MYSRYDKKEKKYLSFPLDFTSFLSKEKHRNIFPSHLILPLFVGGKAKKCFSFLLDFTSICEKKSKEMPFFLS
jgi:hypothetical protein